MIAEKNAFSVRIAQSNYEKARQRLNEANGLVGPHLTTGATYTRFEESGGGSTDEKSASPEGAKKQSETLSSFAAGRLSGRHS